jgi:hypothetical protein
MYMYICITSVGFAFGDARREDLEFEMEVVAQNRDVEDLPPHRRLLLHLLGPV